VTTEKHDRPATRALVSAITIFLNAEEFLAEAIESVLAQTYPNWELWLVDDGSSDGSSQLARDYATRHANRIHYLEHPGHKNRGKSASRNLGLRHARGQYVALLDADDVWLPGKLTNQVPLLEAHPEAAMLYGQTLVWFSWSGKTDDKSRDYLTQTGLPPNTLVSPPTLANTFIRSEAFIPSPCSMLLRREAIETVGGFEDEFRDQYDDMVLNQKILLRYPVLVVAGCWDRYRQHPDNSCAVALRAGLLSYDGPSPARGEYLFWLERYLKITGMAGTEVWTTLQEQLWPYRHPHLFQFSKRAERAKTATRGIAGRILPPKVRGAIWRAWDLVAPKALILLYHRIADTEIDPHDLCVSPRCFAEQLAVLAQRYTLLSLPQCVEAVRQGRLPRHVAVITFDDGYADNLHVAKPLLERHGFPATLFITTGQISNPREFWWDELEKVFLLPGTLPQHLDMEINGHTNHWELDGAAHHTEEQARAQCTKRADDGTPPGPRLELYQTVHKLLRGLPSGQRAAKMDALLKWSGASCEARPAYRALTAKELVAMAKTNLVDFGAHTVTHPHLPEQELTVQREEIHGGKTALEQVIGRAVRSFSYPYGFYSNPTIELVRQAGYSSACTCIERATRSESDLFQLPRFMVRNWDGDEFARRLHAYVRNG
jgi:glycosyltransferase involved in cell wall biosynthesis/peptidoglycan/xylan/chitin deacetylase (PgdA/CDA1 family)